MPNISSIELNLSPNDNVVNGSWRVNDRPAGRTSINAADLTQCSDQIRKTLSDLNEYVRDNPRLSSEFDEEFGRYNRILKALRGHGADLHRLLLEMPCPLEQFIRGVERRLPLTVFVEDQNVTIPIGFAFDGRDREPSAKPSISDFDGFWLSKFMITIWVTSLTSSLDPVVVPATNFRALFAVDPSEYQDAVEALGERSAELSPVFGIDLGIRETWEDASDAWREMMKFDSVLFFLAHSDGNNIRLAGEDKASFSIKNTFSKRDTRSTTLVVVNACMSLAGNRQGGSSILSIAAREGFAGLIGTEAEILNTHALLCGSFLMHGLCFENLMLGEAFERMRGNPTLFPLNLFYSCYGDRSFRLDMPMPIPAQIFNGSEHSMRDSTIWPSLPYRGLDFYEETHTALFRERDSDTLSCVRLLTRFNVKILILQGSSGAGKSSFLRAGLLPALKRLSGKRPEPPWRAVFLNTMHGVIRCTSDPTSAIAAAIEAALGETAVFEGAEWSGDASIDHKVVVSELSGVPPRDNFAALAANDVVRTYDHDAFFGPEEETRSELRHAIATAREAVQRADDEPAARQAYRNLARTLVNALAKLCSDPDRKLFLILDQVEEALTRTTGTQRTSPAAAGFFYFLEELYVRNLNLRAVVSLRTEYYGRFRDEFRISDSRLGERPDDGGVEPFLLRPLRESEALINAFEYPTKVRTEDGDLVYPFAYEKGLLPKIVDDVLRLPELGNGSVTPLISMACAYLHAKLPNRAGVVKSADFPGILEILGDYLKHGIQPVGGDGIKCRSAWLELLYMTLVSRQGGGTVVSLTESTDAFRRQAQINEFEISDDRIRPALVLLTTGTTPLLRGEPPGPEPVYFSLKHDALAVILDRRHTEYVGSAREAERAERERTRAEREQARARSAMYSLLGTVLLAGIISAALIEWVYISKQQQLASDQAVEFSRRQQRLSDDAAAREIEGSSRLRDGYAARPLASDFRQSLLVLLANLKTNEAGARAASRYAETYDKARAYSLASLRNVLVRVPRIVGHYAAAGLDPTGKRLMLLRRRTGEVLVTPLAGGGNNDPYTTTTLRLPDGWEPENQFGNPAVGFLDGMGVAVYIRGWLFHWDQAGNADRIDLRTALGDLVTGIPEFTGGRLIIRRPPKAGFSSGAPLKWDVVRLDAGLIGKIKSNASQSIDQARIDLPPQPVGSPLASLSGVSDNEYFAMVTEDHRSITCGADTTAKPCNLPRFSTETSGHPDSFQTAALIYGKPGQPPAPPLPIGLSPVRALQEVRPFTFAFVAGSNAVAVKAEDASVWVHDLPAPPDAGIGNAPSFTLGPFPEKVGDLQTLRLSAAAGSWLAAPFAVSRSGNHWSAAWIAENGLWAAASTEADPERANPVGNGTLLTGEPGGSSLKLTDDGTGLLLVQQPRWGGPYVVRFWDLRPEWIDWLRNQADGADEATLTRLSCTVLRSESGRRGGSTRMELDRYELDVFQIGEAFKAPCGENNPPVEGEDP